MKTTSRAKTHEKRNGWSKLSAHYRNKDTSAEPYKLTGSRPFNQIGLKYLVLISLPRTTSGSRYKPTRAVSWWSPKYLEAVGKIECFWSAHDYTALFTLYILQRDQARNNAPSLVRGTSVGNLMHESGYIIVILTHWYRNRARSLHTPYIATFNLHYAFRNLFKDSPTLTRWPLWGQQAIEIRKYSITIIIWRFGNSGKREIIWAPSLPPHPNWKASIKEIKEK